MIEAKPGQKVKAVTRTVECFEYCGVLFSVVLGMERDETGGVIGWAAERVAVCPPCCGLFTKLDIDITQLCAEHGELLDAVEKAAVKSVYDANGAEVSHE